MIARAALVWMSVLGSGLAAEPDLDGDGWTEPTDCDDTDPAVNPGAEESCNGADDDCDGLIDDEDTEGRLIGAHNWWIDSDGDGIGGRRISKRACTQPSGYVHGRGDCDDEDAAVGELFATHPDADGDGYGHIGWNNWVCFVPDGYVLDESDCDDGNSATHPGATETCNQVDDNCDGLVDERDPLLVGTTFYEDTDRDGYGDDLTADSTGCEPPYRYVAMGGDCDVASVATHPDAPEICDGEDNDCDAAVDESVVNVNWFLDADGDGYGVPSDVVRACAQPSGYSRGHGDCDDGDAAVSPSIAEVCRNGVDDDCDGGTDNCLMNADEVADFIVAPTVDGTSFGARLASADVDGDGIGDLAVVAGPGAFLFRGPLSGTATTDAAAFTVTGPVGAVAVGDVDDDGLSELLLGAPSLGATGGAYLFHGPLTGQSDVSEADATFGSTLSYKHAAGESVSIIADHTGDGVADLLVGNTGQDNRTGSVYVVSGALTGTRNLISASSYVYKGEEDHDRTGESVAAVGDQNGDGLEDILIGAPDGRGNRRAFVVNGGEPVGRYDVEDVAAAVLDGAGGFIGTFGTDLASGDLDGDGYEDAVISVPYVFRADHPGGVVSAGGVVFAFLGPLSGAIGVLDAAARWEGELGFGQSVAAGSDVDGDGSTDILIGAPYDDDNTRSTVFLGLGPASGVINAAQMISFRSPADHRLGTDVSFVPDTNGDGRPEIAAGAPYAADGAGAVYVTFSDSLFE